MITPNWVETVYKSRFSEFPKECKIFSFYNLGNMRKIEMFVTDKDFKIIKDIKGVGYEELDDKFQMRGRLVQEIDTAYRKHLNKNLK